MSVEVSVDISTDISVDTTYSTHDPITVQVHYFAVSILRGKNPPSDVMYSTEVEVYGL